MDKRTVVVIGNFDGVHGGHQELLAEASELAAELGGDGAPLRLVVVTLWPHPLRVVAPEHAPKLLSGLSERLELLKRAGASEVRVVQFSAEVAAWSPEHFVDVILRPLNPAVVCVGENFTFGHRASGTVATLRELAGDDFEVRVLELAEVDGEESSSTVIRKALERGDVETAAEHLRRPFRIRGVVVVGDQRGRHLGFPTANLPIGPDQAVPEDGVYAGWVTRLDQPDAEPWPAAISVGTNPTFAGLERRVESYVLDRDDLELYGVEIAVDFVAHLRGQITFDGIEGLIEQMRTDVAGTRRALGLG